MPTSVTRPFKRDYAAILAEYPAKTSLRKIARSEGIPYNSLQRNVSKHELRPKRHKKPSGASKRRIEAEDPIIRELTAGYSDMQILAQLSEHFTPHNKILSWRKGLHSPTLATVHRLAAAQGKSLMLADHRGLNTILDKVNQLRQEDMSGPEACAVITDLIFEAMDKQGG